MSQNSSYMANAKLSARGMRIAIVRGRFNHEVTDKLAAGAREELKRLGIEPKDLVQVDVAGAFEIPLAAKALLQNGFDGVVALGAIVRGETTHYDYVCAAVERGCTQTALELSKPIGFGVLTTESMEQAYDRAGGRHGNKGAESAQVTVEMVSLLREIQNGQLGGLPHGI